VSVIARRLAALVVAASVGLGLVGSPEPATGATRRPNVLIIVTDDQRLDTLRAVPGAMRWFRRGGVTLPNAYVSTPLCCPSRASIMTGQFVHNHRVRTNDDGAALDQRSTIQRYLHRAGYRTALIGKYLNGWRLRRDPPHFDRWVLFNRGYYKRPFNINGTVRTVPGYTTDFLSEHAVRTLQAFEGRDRRPWFMYVAPFAPHHPFRAAARHARAPVPPWQPSPAVLEEDRTDKPQWVQEKSASPRRGRKVRRRQFRTLMAVDDLVERTLGALGRLRERDRTLAVLVSDNGFFWAEHGLGDKRLPYTEAIRIPLFLRWPGRIEGGTSDERIAQTVDIMPTVMDAVGISPSSDYPVDGHSLLRPQARDRILTEYFVDAVSPKIPDWASIRTDVYQYVEYYGTDGEVKLREYYDLQSDPWQLTNLLGDDDPLNDPTPAQIAALSTRLSLDRRCEGTSGPNACP
jgi:arylsulfatase A-like enzyme